MDATLGRVRRMGPPERWFIVPLAFVLYALGGHSLQSTIGPGVDIDAIRMIRAGGDPLRLLGYGVLAVIACFGFLAAATEGSAAHKRVRLGVLCSLAWMALSVTWSNATQLSLKTLIGALVLWISCAGIGQLLSIDNIRIVSLLYAGTVTVLGVVCELMLSTWHPFAPGYRFSGTIHPNGQGLICALLILGLVTCAPGRRWLRLLRSAAAVSVLALLLLTQSRAALVAVAVSIFMLKSARWRPHRIFAFLSAFCFLAGVTIIVLYYWQNITSELSVQATLERDTIGADSVGGARFAIWRECSYYLSKHPLLGYGYGAFWSENRLIDMTETLGFLPGHAHSGFLDTALNIGLVGCALLVTTLFGGLTIYFRNYRLTRRLQAGYAAGVIVLLLTNMIFESPTSTTCAVYIVSLFLLMKQAFLGAPADHPRNWQSSSWGPSVDNPPPLQVL